MYREDKTGGEVYDSRLKKMLLVAMLIIFVLIGRMAWLQLYKGYYYGEQADGNRMRSSVIMAPRGKILDCRGEVMVDNVSGYRVGAQPLRRPDKAALAKLSSILNIPLEKMEKKLQKAGKTYETVYFKYNLSPEEVTAIEENHQELSGILLDVQPVRRYCNDAICAHALGYVGEASEKQLKAGREKGLVRGSIVGKDGIELKYDKYLRGKDGLATDEVDVRGHIVRQLAGQAPLMGKNLQLTIDMRMQRVMEKAVDDQLEYLHRTGFAPNAYAAAAVALDPNTGAVKAIVSRPEYNPNWFVGGISSKNWSKIRDNKFYPLSNKVISGQYPPGSTFKIVTGAAALDMGKVTPEEKIFDSGKYWRADMGNAGGEALGWINFRKALAASDNVYFYEMGYRVGIEGLDNYAKKFGLGRKTGIDLIGESSGLLASPAVKEAAFHEPWRLGDTFNAAIGQGFNLATPIQLAQMTAAVATGGVLHRPYLVDKVLNEDGSVYMTMEQEPGKKLNISARTMKLLRQGLESVAEEGGTASILRTLPGDTAGKTGTSENPHGRDHGLFVAYAPADKPEIVVVCVVEQGWFGSVSAVPIVYKVLDAYLRDYPEAEEKKDAEA